MIKFVKIPFFLTSRYIRRGNKWTFLLIIFLIAIAFVNLVFLSSLFDGIVEMSNKQAIDTYAGHITVTPNDDWIDDVSSKMTEIEKIDGVNVVAPRLVVPASMRFGSAAGNFRFFAVSPDREKELTTVFSKMTEGSYLSGDDQGKIILGKEVAGGKDTNMGPVSLQGAKAGDKILLIFNGKSLPYTVKGVFFTKYMFTDNTAFITINDLENIYPTISNKASSIQVKVEKGKDEKEIAKQITDKLGLKTYTWEENIGYMKSINRTFTSLRAIFAAVGALIAAVTIFIVIYVDIANKKQEIGVLRAIGIKPELIQISYVLEALVYSLLGIILGMMIFVGILAPYFTKHPFPLPIGDAELIYNIRDLIFKILIVLVVTIISGFIPAYTTTRIKMLEAIRGK